MIPANLGEGKEERKLTKLVKYTQTSALFDFPE